MSARILVIGSTRSPGHGSGTGPWNSVVPPGAYIDAPVPERAEGPAARWLSKSCLVTRPAIPLPFSPAMFTPCSAAILRTRGDDLERRRPSKVSADASGGADDATVTRSGEGAPAGATDGATDAGAGAQRFALAADPA